MLSIPGHWLLQFITEPSSKIQIDNDVNWSISSSPVDGCANNVTQIAGLRSLGSLPSAS
jgi:hypothetical protein